MSYTFPATKFVEENTIDLQVEHVRSEFFEFFYETDIEKKIEEAIDLYHSLETLFRIMEKEGFDIEKAFEAVKQKNQARGYYD